MAGMMVKEKRKKIGSVGQIIKLHVHILNYEFPVAFYIVFFFFVLFEFSSYVCYPCFA